MELLFNKAVEGDPKLNQIPGTSTRAIHLERSFAENTGTLTPPIFPSSTFAHGNQEGFDYTRSGNPNFRILESVLASLENCQFATVFNSGISAITAIASTLRAGDLVICEDNLYGCTVRLFEKVFHQFGLKTCWLDMTQYSSIEKISILKPAMIWLESPTNPLLKIIDLQKVCNAANKENIPVVVDNTFSTSLIQKPLELGAIISLTSTTKYINGHCDALGGVVCTKSPDWNMKMRFAQKALGLHPSPFDCWLITRGVKTLPLRLERQTNNASTLANKLAEHSLIEWVRYPFRSDHPQREIAKKQMLSGGAVITASLKGSKETTYDFCKSLKYFTMAESLGGVESLICHPSTMTHASVPINVKERLGIDDSVIRLSIGCEDEKDLNADLEQALTKIS